MIRYATVTPTPETRRLCAIAVEVAAVKLGVETVPLIFIQENPEGRIEKPWRIRGAMEPDARGDVHFFLNVNQSPEALVRTAYHEVRHLKTLIDYLDRGQGPTSEINEAQAEFFAHSEAPRGDYNELLARLCEDGAKLALEADQTKSAAAFADMLAPLMPKAAKKLRESADLLAKTNVALARLDGDWVAPSTLAARHAQVARKLQREVEAERRRRWVAETGERVRAAAARAAAADKEQARQFYILTGQWL